MTEGKWGVQYELFKIACNFSVIIFAYYSTGSQEFLKMEQILF